MRLTVHLGGQSINWCGLAARKGVSPSKTSFSGALGPFVFHPAHSILQRVAVVLHPQVQVRVGGLGGSQLHSFRDFFDRQGRLVAQRGVR